MLSGESTYGDILRFLVGFPLSLVNLKDVVGVQISKNKQFALTVDIQTRVKSKNILQRFECFNGGEWYQQSLNHPY